MKMIDTLAEFITDEERVSYEDCFTPGNGPWNQIKCSFADINDSITNYKIISKAI